MTDPTPASDDAPVEAAELLELRRRVDALEQETVSLRRFGVIALVVAALACGGAVSAHSAGGGDADRLRRLEEGLAKHEHAAPSAIPARFLPRERDSERDPKGGVRAERVSELERRIDDLERRASGGPSRGGDAPAQDVESALVAWGAETRRYVDDALARVGEEQQRLRGEELTRVWDRVLDIEARLDGR